MGDTILGLVQLRRTLLGKLTQCNSLGFTLQHLLLPVVSLSKLFTFFASYFSHLQKLAEIVAPYSSLMSIKLNQSIIYKTCAGAGTQCKEMS